MAFGYVGTMKTKPGQREEVVAILLTAAEALAGHGCRSYVVARDEGDADTIVVTEVWETREAHDASLQLPSAKEAIGTAMPMLTGEFSGWKTEIAGGLGA